VLALLIYKNQNKFIGHHDVKKYKIKTNFIEKNITLVKKSNKTCLYNIMTIPLAWKVKTQWLTVKITGINSKE